MSVLTIQSQSNTDGVTNKAIINCTTDSTTATAQTFNIGFVPRKVVITMIAGTGFPIEWTWYEGLPANTLLKSVSTGPNTVDTAAGGITVPGAVTDTSSLPGTITVPASIMLVSGTFVIEVDG